MASDTKRKTKRGPGEYLADATAAQFTRNPVGLARALEKIGAAMSPLRSATRGEVMRWVPRWGERPIL